ncbi:MAG: nicotinate (nicotinamide) nucleotide adenylyltransferase [Actinobacteria bacterium]|nr:nicotinate (nicotinamide) nucleotide adenylyltransferase [Actinomycetota bacterium]
MATSPGSQRFVIGIYGGTFDPIHNGHLHVIKQLLQSHRVDRIIVVPAGDPQLRERPVASSRDRLEMCRLAVESLSSLRDRVEVSAIEVERDRPSFAIDTVEAMMANHPGKEFAWIIGSDAFRRIDQWHESERLRELISFIVIERPANQGGSEVSDDEFDDVGGEEIDALQISATEIRSRLALRESISELVPSAVIAYIESKGLYGSA